MAELDTELNQSDEEVDTSGNTPVTPQSPDLEALVRSVLGDTLKSELDSRFSGLQSIQDKRLTQLAKELKASNLTQDQQDAILEQEQEKETSKALQIAELIKRRKSAPEAVDFLLESMEKDDLDDQIAFIQSTLRASTSTKTSVPASPTTGDEDDDEGQIPESTKNNPPSRRSALESDEDGMNEELADQILDQVGKGQLSRFFNRR